MRRRRVIFYNVVSCYMRRNSNRVCENFESTTPMYFTDEFKSHFSNDERNLRAVNSRGHANWKNTQVCCVVMFQQDTEINCLSSKDMRNIETAEWQPCCRMSIQAAENLDPSRNGRMDFRLFLLSEILVNLTRYTQIPK